MSHPEAQEPVDVDVFDVIVVGAGSVGLVLSIALAQAGFSVCVVGPTAAIRPGRTVALFQGSIALLRELRLWDDLVRIGSPLQVMRLVDATGSLFRQPPVNFEAAEIGLDAFGYNVENAALDAVLDATVRQTSGLTRIEGTAAAFAEDGVTARVTIDGRGPIHGRLVAAADGRQSRARKTARIGVRIEAQPQVALTALFTHSAPHQNISTEFHTRQGPFTLVPLRDDPEGAHRSSLVWVMSPAEGERRSALSPVAFALEAERQCVRLLGSMTVASAVGRFPIVTSTSVRLTGPRLVLTGEAAHALPPIGAQGLNLSFRDVAALVDQLKAARSQGTDIGSASVLDRYARSRAGDIASRVAGVGLLNGSLLAHSLGADFARGAGLTALGAIGPLRRFAMRRGLVPDGRVALADGGDRGRAGPSLEHKSTSRGASRALDVTYEDQPSSGDIH